MEERKEEAVITTVVLTKEQAQWLLTLGQKLFPPKSPIARPSLSRTLRAVLQWLMNCYPEPDSVQLEQ